MGAADTRRGDPIMRTPHFLSTTNGRRAAIVAAGLSVFATAGVAAAAAGGAPFLGFHTSDAAVVEPVVTDAPTTVPVSTEPAPTTVPAAHEPPATPPAATEPATVPPTEPAATEPPTTAPASTEPARTDPPAPKPDTVVPEGIHLECVLDNHTAKCHWTGSAVDGFAKVLVLRSDGRVVFMSADPAASEYANVDLAPGSYSWIVVTIDANGKTLVHSNRVGLQIGSAA
jgi:hypothetical protein